jgi:hypothetical protein
MTQETNQESTQETNQLSDLPIPSSALQPAAALAGPPPLIAGESAAGFDELLARVTATLQPSDVIEQMFIREIVDLVWEVHRMRRLKANLMASRAHEGMTHVLRPLLGGHPGDSTILAYSWAARRADAVSKVEATLAAAGFTMDHVAAATLAAHVSDFERIDRMTAYAEGRRNSALHELDRHRSSFALRLRQTLEEIEDAEFEVVPAAHASGESSQEVAA